MNAKTMTVWELQVCTGNRIPLKVSSQLERIPPIDVLTPITDAKINAAGCGPYGRLPIHIWPSSSKWRPWQLLHAGQIYDTFYPSGWMQIAQGDNTYTINGQRSTVHLRVSPNKHTLTLLSIRRPQSLQEYKLSI
jgi:hypothetical protein